MSAESISECVEEGSGSDAEYELDLLRRYSSAQPTTGRESEVMAALVTEIVLLREKQEEILSHIQTISEQVKPTLDALAKSPIMRMLGAK